jgi:type IV secretion system protein VirB10
VLLAWDRLILPGGRSILLDRQPGGDASGFAGLQDKVNYHWGNMLRAALISTALGVGTEMATDNNDPLVRLSATAHRIPSTRSGSSSFSVKSMWRRR